MITFGEIISKMEDSSQNRIGFLNTETISISSRVAEDLVGGFKMAVLTVRVDE